LIKINKNQMKPGIFKRILLLNSLIVFLITGCTSNSDKIKDVQGEIDSIAARFIPDRRMGIADITAKSGAEGELILKGETSDNHLKNTLIKALVNSGNKLIDSVLILPDTLTNKNYCGLAALSVINIRKHPAHSAELVNQTLMGTPVRIFKSDDDWLLIQTPDNYIGWVESTSVALMTASGIAEWKRSVRVITLAYSGWIYDSPGESGTVGDFVAGCILIKEGESGAYTKVRLPDGREGYISSKSLMDFNRWRATVSCTEESILRSAAGFLGLPYLWGGTSTKAVDCSGFSRSVFYMNGIILLRDASLQALHGLKVDITSGYGQLKPGDLLFFGTSDNSKNHVTHVAVYKGDKEYYNSSGRVIINSFDSTRSNYNGYRVTALLSARRVIGVNDDPGIVSIRTHPWY
jgi:gamma-D-glutamyl-L-lysine dipeptidyl-peptidase